MSWRSKVFFLFIVLIPSFIGYPFNIVDSHILFGWAEQSTFLGPTDGQMLYLCLVMIIVPLICGIDMLYFGLTAGALVSLSILFLGGFIAYIKTNFGIMDSPTELQYSPYYIAKFTNIITVVPLSIALFLSVPFLQYERSILTSTNGVTIRQKTLLMIVRVINNVRYSVIPNIWSIITEENITKMENKEFGTYIEGAINGKNVTVLEQMKKIFSRNIHIVASGIASSLEFIPLWAIEISKIPIKKSED